MYNLFKNNQVAGSLFSSILMISAYASCGTQIDKMISDTDNDPNKTRRELMVSKQLEGRDIKNPSVLEAMKIVPRHKFVPEAFRSEAYDDWPLPVGEGQTISQPYIVAYMTQALDAKKSEKILEIGTGSGYQAAVLAQIGAEVYSIEIIEPLGNNAKKTLFELGYNVNVIIGDGFDGLPEHAPFDGILVTAAPENIPKPLIKQLKEGGRLVIPVGKLEQTLKVYKKIKDELMLIDTLPVRFVPMTGKAAENP